jgi:hypothetical protein
VACQANHLGRHPETHGLQEFLLFSRRWYDELKAVQLRVVIVGEQQCHELVNLNVSLRRRCQVVPYVFSSNYSQYHTNSLTFQNDQVGLVYLSY